MVKMYRATFLRPGKAVSETIISQKWKGQFLQTAVSGPHLLGDQPIASGEAQHLPI